MQLKTQQKTGFGIFTQRGFFYSKVSNRRGGGVEGEGGSEYVSFRERVKSWYFIEIPQVVQKI